MVALKKLPAMFFRTATGNEPVREWMRDLPLEDKKALGGAVADVEYGWPLAMPVCRSLGNGLWEVRATLPSGRIARVIFVVTEGCMVLLHGFIKKTQKTPQGDLELAQKRCNELSRRKA